MRLNKYLAACGLGSRRGVEELILGGKVRVNGQIADTLATKVETTDEVVVGGRKVRPQGVMVIALHKPKGFVCTRSDEKDRRTLYDLLPREFQSLHHIGRLDMDSSGLILLTNDGDLSHRLTHPSKGIEKEYEVTVEEPLDETVVPKCLKGMMTPEGFAKAERAWIIGNYKIGMVLTQGLKRQIRHMLYYTGHEVRRLERVRIGHFHLKGMREGSWKELSQAEVDRLVADAAAPKKPRRAPSDGEESQVESGDEFAPSPRPRRSTGGPAKKGGARRFTPRSSSRTTSHSEERHEESGDEFASSPRPRRSAGGPAKKGGARKFTPRSSSRTSSSSGAPAENRRPRPSRPGSSDRRSSQEGRPASRGPRGGRRPGGRGADE